MAHLLVFTFHWPKGHMTKFVINRVNIYKASSSQGPIGGMTILNINTVYHRKQLKTSQAPGGICPLLRRTSKMAEARTMKDNGPVNPLPLRAGLRANQETFPLPKVPCQPAEFQDFYRPVTTRHPFFPF